MNLTTRRSKPITIKKAKQLGLHSVTRPYLESETWMALNALIELRKSNIKARLVHSAEKIPGAVEVWRT
jgi:hypothetical protein